MTRGERIERIRAALGERTKALEKELGLKRLRTTFPCPRCHQERPVHLESETVVEGGYVHYDPPRIYEWANCLECSLVSYDVYEHVHQEGRRV